MSAVAKIFGKLLWDKLCFCKLLAESLQLKNKLLHVYFLRILSRDFIHRYPLKFTISEVNDANDKYVNDVNEVNDVYLIIQRWFV